MEGEKTDIPIKKQQPESQQKEKSKMSAKRIRE